MYLYIYLYIRYSILFTDCLKRTKARGREIECKVLKKGRLCFTSYIARKPISKLANVRKIGMEEGSDLDTRGNKFR